MRGQGRKAGWTCSSFQNVWSGRQVFSGWAHAAIWRDHWETACRSSWSTMMIRMFGFFCILNPLRLNFQSIESVDSGYLAASGKCRRLLRLCAIFLNADGLSIRKFYPVTDCTAFCCRFANTPNINGLERDHVQGNHYRQRNVRSSCRSSHNGDRKQFCKSKFSRKRRACGICQGNPWNCGLRQSTVACNRCHVPDTGQ